MLGRNPFEEVLKNFKPAKKFGVSEEATNEELLADEKMVSSEGVDFEAQIPQSEEDKSEQERQEDEALFSELAGIFGFKESDRSYSRVKKLIFDSRRKNVAFDIDRLLSFELRRTTNSRASEIVDLVLKRGFASEALHWLQSATPNGMQYGTYAREVRIEHARKFAETSGVSLEEIARNNNIPL